MTTMAILALAGLLISILVKLARIRKRFRDEFSLRVWWAENNFQSVAAVISVGVMLYFAPLFAPAVIGVEIPQGSMFYDLFALCAGYSNHALFHDLMKAYKIEK